MSIPQPLGATEETPNSNRSFGFLSILGGLLGLYGSFRLFLDYVASLNAANFVPSCDLSDTISCAANLESTYGSLLGFSNTALGLVLFVVPVVIGVLVLSGVELPRWLGLANLGGNLGAVALVTYLQWASFTQLETLCIYCLIIWLAVLAIFWSSLAFVARQWMSPHRAGGLLGFISSYWGILWLAHLLVILGWGELSIGAVSELLATFF